VSDVRFLFTTFLGPVALICWALIALAVLLWRARVPAAARWLCVAITAFVMVTGCPYVANKLLRRLEKDPDILRAQCAPPAPGSVLVVLAGGLDRAAADVGDLARLSEESFRRTVAGVRLAKEVPDSLLLMSGGLGGQVREADLMGTLAVALGMPESRLLLEREARSTYQNAMRLKPLIEGFKGRPVYLVTSAMHMRRAAAVFWSSGLNVCPLPVDFQFREPEGVDAVIPRVDSMLKTTESLHEMVGYLAYRARGYIHAGALERGRAMP
jgi:uncharacterized SAM-binding protein YcdF (DUF218 family)